MPGVCFSAPNSPAPPLETPPRFPRRESEDALNGRFVFNGRSGSFPPPKERDANDCDAIFGGGRDSDVAWVDVNQ